MRLTIDTNILRKYGLSLGEYIVLLLGYYDVDIGSVSKELENRELLSPDLFRKGSSVLSNNTRNLVARIIMESDSLTIQSNIDFESLARKLQSIYPEGNKAGTTYPWRGTTEEIAQKLRTLVAKYHSTFTEEEAIRATEEYVRTCTDTKTMLLLRNFLLRTRKDNTGQYDIVSVFLTIIENNRMENENNSR